MGWSGTPWLKMLMAVLLAQGIYYAVWHVLRAGELALGNEDLFRFLARQTLQMAAVALGGVLAGAGQRNGLVTGAVVGIWNGAIFLVAEYFSGHSFSLVEMYSQPMLHTAFGAAGGLVGGWVWPPPAQYRRPIARPPSSLTVRRTIPKLLMKHVHWTRVCMGLAIAAGGYLYAETILEFARHARPRYRGGSLPDEVMTWEIRLLALLVGGAFSGSCTFNGSVQGAWVGLASFITVTGALLAYNPALPLQPLLLTAGATLIVPLIGGWFGGRLLPPLLPDSPKGYKRIPY